MTDPSRTRIAAAARARAAIRDIPTSGIRQLANAAIGRPDVLPFWFGEADEATPEPIRQAACEALAAGDTFYTPNLGLAELREAIAGYQSSLYGPIGADRIVVTNSGVSALMLAAQAIIEPGDTVVAVVPLWPNLTAIPAIFGAQVRTVALSLRDGHWQLDVQQLIEAITPDTRALILNSPGNPTGWTMPEAALAQVLAHCRSLGTWVISDEAYHRLVFDGSERAASALDHAQPEDRVIVANTFSKTWRMTGWRLGWLTVPPSLLEDLSKLVEFNTSCAPGFVQRAGLAALASPPESVTAFVQELRARRDALTDLLLEIPGIELGIPQGAMYAFFRVQAQPDSVALAHRLLNQVGLGLAPGRAFGPEGEGYLRWCFARPVALLEQGVARLRQGLGR
jgi:aspartate/methionine/tyrosine aminotransferase